MNETIYARLTRECQEDRALEMVGLLHVVLDCGECAMPTVSEHNRSEAHEKPKMCFLKRQLT